jgi:hypothetical protein
MLATYKFQHPKLLANDGLSTRCHCDVCAFVYLGFAVYGKLSCVCVTCKELFIPSVMLEHVHAVIDARINVFSAASG